MQNEGDDLPTLVFTGEYSEAIFLKSLLEAAAIQTSLVTSLGGRAAQAPCLYVRRRDAREAQDLVADFLRNGKRTIR